MNKRIGLSILALTIGALNAFAVPVVGVYDSFGGVFTGHASEGYNGGTLFSPGNMLNEQSWNGSALGTQWTLAGMTSTGAVQTGDYTVGGTGTKTYHIDYAGGTFSIADPGSAVGWGSGNGLITTYSHDMTVTYQNGSITGITNNISAQGIFTSNPGYTLDFVIANSVRVGEGPVPPGSYPAYLGLVPPGMGSWYNVNDIVVGISNVVPEPGAFAALGTGLIGFYGMVRRRKA